MSREAGCSGDRRPCLIRRRRVVRRPRVDTHLRRRSSQNGYFAGGHGDVSVITDPEGKYFYFFSGNYSGRLETQGVAVAGLALRDRYNPVGNVWKYYQGAWTRTDTTRSGVRQSTGTPTCNPAQPA